MKLALRNLCFDTWFTDISLIPLQIVIDSLPCLSGAVMYKRDLRNNHQSPLATLAALQRKCLVLYANRDHAVFNLRLELVECEKNTCSEITYGIAAGTSIFLSDPRLKSSSVN